MVVVAEKNVSDFSLYNKKKCCSKGGLQPPQPLPWIRLWENLSVRTVSFVNFHYHLFA